jgi:hypothetical protein
MTVSPVGTGFKSLILTNGGDDECSRFRRRKARNHFQRIGEDFYLYENGPLYDFFSERNYYQRKEGFDLVISLSNIEEVENTTKQDCLDLQDKMGCNPADDATLLGRKFLILPEPEEACNN